MNLHNQIQEYLLIQSPDYNVGVSLFLQFSTNRNLQHSLMRCKDVARLRYELQKYLKSNVETPTVVLLPGFISKPEKETVSEVIESDVSDFKQPTIAHQVKEPISSSRRQEDGRLKPEKQITSSQFEAIHDQVRADWKALYQKRSHFHGRLHEAISDESRYQIALEIEALIKQINEMNEYMKMMNEGDIPLKYIKVKMTADEYIRIRNLKQYISRTERQIADAETIDEKRRFEQKLIEFKNQLSQL